MELAQFKSILSHQYEESVEFQLLEALLISNQNLSTYRSVYRTYLDVAPTLDLLFLNSQNPTSILSQYVLSTKLSAAYFSHSTYQQQGSKDGFQFEV